MATLFKAETTRAPLKARPRKNADIKAVTAEVSEKFAKSLEYLGR